MPPHHGPHYLKLRDTLATQITSGFMAPHSKFPSERKLKENHDINRVTVRQALMQLESEGLIYRLIRRGWYVSPPRLQYDPTHDTGFMDIVSSQDRTPETEVLSKIELAASPSDHEQFGIEIGAPMYQLCRRRSIDGLAVLIEHININANLFPGLLTHPLEGLTDTFKKHYGIHISRTTIKMHPAPLNEEQAEKLQVVAGTPGLYLTRTRYDQNDNIVEYDQEFWRHDAIDVVMEIVST